MCISSCKKIKKRKKELQSDNQMIAGTLAKWSALFWIMVRD